MKILLQSRTNLFDRPGGDTAMMQALANEFSKQGYEAHLSHRLHEDVRPFDVVYLFNLTRPHETITQLHHAKQAGKPVLLSPLFQDFSLWNRYGRVGALRPLFQLLPVAVADRWKNVLKSTIDPRQWRSLPNQLMHNQPTQISQILNAVDLLLPQSPREIEDLHRRVSFNRPTHVVPMGVDPELQHTSPEPFIRLAKQRDFILCVANFSSIKNHLNLLNALGPLDYPVVFIGNQIPFHRNYFLQLQKIARHFPHVNIYEHLSRDLVVSAFAAAKVHVLASWFENSPLVSLEAGILDCNVVNTNQGYASYYFGNHGWVGDPRDPESIQRAVREAMEAPVSAKLKQHILTQFTWKQSAEQVLTAIQTVLPSVFAA